MLNIVPAYEVDLPVLLRLIQAAFEEHRGKLDPPSGVFKETVESLRAKWNRGGGFIAYHEDNAAGGVLYEPEEGFMYLGRLAVPPEFRGQGVARALVETVEQQARTLNLPCVRLGVRVQLPRNRQMFEHLGYQVIRYDCHPGYTEPTMMMLEKKLV